jgi:hypothetical protein
MAKDEPEGAGERDDAPGEYATERSRLGILSSRGESERTTAKVAGKRRQCRTDEGQVDERRTLLEIGERILHHEGAASLAGSAAAKGALKRCAEHAVARAA